MLVLANQAEADWKANFRALLKQATGARVKVDHRKDSVREEAVCIACGRDEERSKFRLDLAGGYKPYDFCQPCDLRGKLKEYRYEGDEAFDFGIFYLGTECLRKLKTAFQLRNFMADLVADVDQAIEKHGPPSEGYGGKIFSGYCEGLLLTAPSMASLSSTTTRLPTSSGSCGRRWSTPSPTGGASRQC